MFKKRFTLTALIALAVLLTAVASQQAQQNELLREEFHQTYSLAGGGRVSLGNINGAVRVTGWDREEVKVDAVKTAYRRDRLDEAKIQVHADANNIRIETEYPDRTQTFTDGQGRYNNPATVEYTLTVPRDARIDAIELINGDLDIEGVSGDVKASSINGRLTARGLTGLTKLSTINGNLEAVFDHLEDGRPVSVGSVNGNVLLTIPSDSNAQLKASTVHGSIRNDFGLPVRHGEYVGHDLAGQLGQGGVLIKLGNVNGGITIRHAADGRPLSRAISSLAENTKDNDNDNDNDNDYDVDDAKAEAQRAARDAAREAARAQREVVRAQAEAARAQVEAQRLQREAQAEAQRVQTEAQREAQRAQVDAQREAQRAQLEAQKATREAQAEAARAAREAQLEGQRAQLEAQEAQRAALAEAAQAQAEAQRAANAARVEAQREAARVRVEAQRVARDAMRERTRDVVIVSDNLRLVERETKSFTVSGMPRVNLQTFDGYISVHAWDKSEVQLTISKRSATEQQMRGINVRADQSGSEVTVVAEFDKNFAARIADGVTSTNALVNLDVYVPRSANVRLNSGDGRLELEGVNGTLDLNTGDGRIEVRDSAGRLLARTGDGRIEVENFKGAINANTGDGRISLDGQFDQLAARTGDGSIMLTLPTDSNATIETDAEAVDNEAGFTLTEEAGPSRRLKRWKIGQGGNTLTLRTGEGHIILRRR